MEEIFEVYILSYNDPIREMKMKKRLEEVKLKGIIFSLKENDSRYELYKKQGAENINITFFNYLFMIEEFYKTGKEYGVFLEDDVYLRKSIVSDLNNSFFAMKKLNLDVLLIGYLVYTNPEIWGCKEIENSKIDNFNYFTYNSELWGTQGFILTRKHAKFYIDWYNNPTYILGKNRKDILASDWTFTKWGNSALQYPPLVVEEGNVKTNHIGQIDFHKKCADFLYDEKNYI